METRPTRIHIKLVTWRDVDAAEDVAIDITDAWAMVIGKVGVVDALGGSSRLIPFSLCENAGPLQHSIGRSMMASMRACD